MCVTLLPFIFLTYQNHVPSRHNYVPVMGLALALAGLFAATRSRRLVGVFVTLIVVANVSYIWFQKDPQFRLRALPTTRLLEEFKRHPPRQILVVDFPLNTWIAKTVARHVKGWEPYMIEVNTQTESCSTCPRLLWSQRHGKYECDLCRAAYGSGRK